MPGSPFGKYLLYERIAAGGMAEIYRAKYVAAAGVTKQVVIKKILPHYAGNRSFVSMFINEVKIAVGLSHGNIAQVFDFGEIDGEYFLAMEYVHGQTVSKILRRAREKGLRVPPPYAVFIATEMSRGLHYAHTRVDEQQRPLNIVHRDISPQNIIVSYEGQVKIVDFGIAKARSASDADKTQAGAIKGKYVYFSPEQARAKDLDGRSDVFATAIVLYEMVCGRLPFDGKMVEVLNKIVRGDFPKPSSINPEIDPKLEGILLKALAVNRDDRYASSLAFQEALTDYLVTVAPRFNQHSLAQLVDYLFSEELSQEGREVSLPASFMEQLNRWKDSELTRAPPVPMADPDDVSEITSADRRSAKVQRISRIAEVTDTSTHHTRSAFRATRAKLFIAIGGFVAAAALGGGAVLYLGRASTYAVKITSAPAGVEVKLDGVPTQKHTPTTITDLSADRPHLIELDTPGMKTWSKQVEPLRGETVSVEAVMEPAPIEDIRAPEALGAGDDRSARDEVPAPTFTAPVATMANTELRLDAAAIALSIPASRAARTRLDPAKTYKLTVEGGAALDDVTRTRGCFYFLERTRSGGGPAFGWLGPKDSVKVSDTRVLYGFVVDPTPGDNSGALTLSASDGKSVVNLPVNARLNAVFPDSSRGARYTGLGERTALQLELQGKAEFGPGQGSVDRAIYWYDGTVDLKALEKNPDLTHGVIRAGEHVTLENPAQVVLFVPDDDTGDNSGALAASVRSTKR